MRTDPIKGLLVHPERQRLAAYAPPGVWRGRLDGLAWGKSTNLFCYFTEIETGKQYRLSVFHAHGYAPYDGGPAFDQEALGGEFEITTTASRNGLPKLMLACRLEPNPLYYTWERPCSAPE